MPTRRRRGGTLLGALALGIAVAAGIGAVRGGSDPDTAIDAGPAKTRVAGVAVRGTPAPRFDLAALSGGGRVILAKYRGRPVVVNFWASWCKECRDEFPVLHDLVTAHRDDGLAVIGITFRDIPSDSRAFARDHEANWILAQGGDHDTAARDYGIRAVPQTFFIDRRGVIRARAFGLPSTAALNAAVAGIVASKP